MPYARAARCRRGNDVNHPVHTFCFAELHTADPTRAASFYGSVFQWTPAHVTSDFDLFRRNGKAIIGMRRTSGPQRLVGYIKVENVDRTAARAQELGGRIDTPPADTAGVARTCVLSDPEGAVFGLWEPRGHDGADVQDQTGSMWWIELMARDIVGARHFYTRLFGWDFSETPKYEIGERLYTVFKTGSTAVAGALQFHPDWGVTPHWCVFFAIDDWDAAIARATAAGGSLGFWRDVPYAGRCGFIEDADGAEFTVMRPIRDS